MNTLNDYKQVQKNTGLVPRTLSEANKDADYATALWVCETENESALKFFADMFVGLVFTGLVVGVLLGFAYWVVS